MKNYLKHHPWQIIEEDFVQDFHEVSESIFSTGNGRFGVRGNFEESYSGKSLRGSYFAGVYYPDLTRVGWWKNGYPEYFAKVLNSVNWIGIDISIDNSPLDLALTPCQQFQRNLDMENGILRRQFVINPSSGGSLQFHFERFCSMADADTAAIRLSIKSIGFHGIISISPYLDFDVHNKDSNYGDQFWVRRDEYLDEVLAGVSAETKKTAFTVSAFMHAGLRKNGAVVSEAGHHKEDMKVRRNYEITVQNDDEIICEKLVVNLSSLYAAPSDQLNAGRNKLAELTAQGYDVMKALHAGAWNNIWNHADITINGDISAQQAIRFNIFQLWQTYTGEDPRLNIGPKGFTGEKYGGSTYWDTEAYCIPFYMSSSEPAVARQLLTYRYLHLPKAIENAQKLGFKDGAALYPMVTINGEECHNEWEITFEEIHRNGAIVYAIYDYIRYTGDTSYLAEGGLEVMIGVARFWSQRVNFSNDKNAYVMLGVTGPNEYENNINNNWYTNYIARWCLLYALVNIEWVEKNDGDTWTRIKQKVNFDHEEAVRWYEVATNMYFPVDEKRNLFLQQDAFLDKEIMPASDLPSSERPINQKWSWDRILRSCFIKQADVLQGMFFFEDHFDEDTIRRHFEFYEPMTVHESSLSPCVHSILASRLGMMDKAMEMYLRTARLDLDDYNNDTEDGLHITSMAGTWMSIVKGFAGLTVQNDKLHLAPVLPVQWEGLEFRVRFRNRLLGISITHHHVNVDILEGEKMEISIHNEIRQL